MKWKEGHSWDPWDHGRLHKPRFMYQATQLLELSLPSDPNVERPPYCSWPVWDRATRSLEGGSDRKPIAFLQWRGPAFFPDSCAVSSRTLRSKKAGPRHPSLRYGRTRCRSICPRSLIAIETAMGAGS